MVNKRKLAPFANLQNIVIIDFMNALFVRDYKDNLLFNIWVT